MATILPLERLPGTIVNSPVLVVGLLLFALFLGSKIINELRSPLRKIPGPFYARFTDTVFQYHTLRGRRLHYLYNLKLEYGSVVRVTPTSVSLGDPDDIKAVLENQINFGKGPWFEGRGGSPPSLITNRDRKDHAWRRRIVGHQFSNTEVRKFEPIVREKVHLAMEKIGEESRKEGEANVLKWFMFMATDVIGDLSFGDSFRMLQRGKKDEYIEQLEDLMLVETLRLDLPLVFWFLKISRLSRKVNNVSIDRFVSYGSQSINRLKSALSASAGNVKPNFFSHILADDKHRGLSDLQIIQQAAEFIFAGSDTTTNSLTWLVWMVLQDPDIHRRLVEEVGALSKDYSLAELDALPYLNAVLSETLRIYGAASGDIQREVSSSGHTFQGFYLPQGTLLEVQTYTMHMSSKYFPEPESFKPERWLHSNPGKSYFMPFGGGSRTCIGIHLAYFEMRLAIAEFFRTYPNAKLTGTTKAADMEIENYVVNTPKGRALFVQV